MGRVRTQSPVTSLNQRRGKEDPEQAARLAEALRLVVLGYSEGECAACRPGEQMGILTKPWPGKYPKKICPDCAGDRLNQKPTPQLEIVPSLLPSSLSDPLFRFEEREHRYFYGDRELQSASAWIKEVEPRFDAAEVSKRVAKKRGVTAESLLKEWDDARDEGSRLGSLVHLAIEKHLGGEPLPDLDPEAQRRFDLFLKLMDGRLKGSEVIGQEVRLYSLKYGIAGTADLILRLASGKLFIGDWKTNKQFRHGEDGFERLLPPFDHLVKNEGNTYSIQSALYRIMLAEHGLEADGCFIAHLGPGASEPLVFFPPDLRPFVTKRLELSLAL
jgi:hypothetical protein